MIRRFVESKIEEVQTFVDRHRLTRRLNRLLNIEFLYVAALTIISSGIWNQFFGQPQQTAIATPINMTVILVGAGGTYLAYLGFKQTNGSISAGRIKSFYVVLGVFVITISMLLQMYFIQLKYY